MFYVVKKPNMNNNKPPYKILVHLTSSLGLSQENCCTLHSPDCAVVQNNLFSSFILVNVTSPIAQSVAYLTVLTVINFVSRQLLRNSGESCKKHVGV